MSHLVKLLLVSCRQIADHSVIFVFSVISVTTMAGGNTNGRP
jgi:hypothetical protein